MFLKRVLHADMPFGADIMAGNEDAPDPFGDFVHIGDRVAVGDFSRSGSE